jgi:hypothetical protein
LTERAFQTGGVGGGGADDGKAARLRLPVEVAARVAEVEVVNDEVVGGMGVDDADMDDDVEETDAE